MSYHPGLGFAHSPSQSHLAVLHDSPRPGAVANPFLRGAVGLHRHPRSRNHLVRDLAGVVAHADGHGGAVAGAEHMAWTAHTDISTVFDLRSEEHTSELQSL